jgi:hypothetical protein
MMMISSLDKNSTIAIMIDGRILAFSPSFIVKR